MENPCVKIPREEKMESSTRTWRAVPILSPEFTEDLPLQEVYVGIVKQKKDISTAIPSISNAMPGFHHLKRCSGNNLLLAPLKKKNAEVSQPTSKEDEYLSQDELKSVLKERGFDISVLEDEFQIVSVPFRAPRTKAQAARASKIWPVNFHSDPNIESVIDGSIFEEHHLNSIESYMRVILEAAKLGAVGNSYCNGSAVIVDPEDGRILAIAASRIDLHPMWHASMVAIDLVAKLQGGGAWDFDKEECSIRTSNSDTEEKKEDIIQRGRSIKRKYQEEAPLIYPKSLTAIQLPVQTSLKSKIVRKGRKNNGCSKKSDSNGADCKTEVLDVDKCGPYLCTGYWAFLLKEPCPLCAMALLHSRVLRIFYGVANKKTGVLGSNEVLHAVPGLNHRYQVWSGILEEESSEVARVIDQRRIS